MLRRDVDKLRLIFKLLKFLDQPRTYTDIERGLGLSYKTILKLMDDLEEVGLIERELDPTPPQRYIVKRTKLGDCIAKCLTES